MIIIINNYTHFLSVILIMYYVYKNMLNKFIMKRKLEL